MINIDYTRDTNKPLLTIGEADMKPISELLHLTILEMIKGRDGLIKHYSEDRSYVNKWVYKNNDIEYLIEQLIERGI